MQVLTNQEFTYRESPAEQNGYGKFKALYGNTLVWNQLVQNGNFADSSSWTGQFATVSISNGIANVTLSAKGDYVALRRGSFSSVADHKYFVTATFKSAKKTAVGFYLNGQYAYTTGYDVQANTQTTVSSLIDGGSSGGFNVYVSRKNELEIGDVVQVSNVMLIDLTQMFGSGNEPSTVEEFTSLFPLSYYSYNQGSLLSFMGNGIKTVGFNQWDEEWEVGAYNSTSGDKTDSVRDRIRNKNPIRVFPSVNYYVSKGLQFYYYDANMNFLSWNNYLNPTIITPPSNAYYLNFNGLVNSGTTYNNDICINISSSRNGQYEPYKENIIEIPLDEFPDGMDGFNDIHDEKNETGYAKKIAQVDLGSLTWEYRTTGSVYAPYFYTAFTGIKPNGNPNVRKANILCSKYSTAYRSQESFIDKTICADGSSTELTQLQIKDSSYTDATSFKTSLSGVIFKYEMLVPLENYGVVDLGTITYTYDGECFIGQLPSDVKVLSANTETLNSVCNKYLINNWSSVKYLKSNMTLGTGVNRYICIFNSSYTDPSAFKTAMSNVYLLYEKQNPQGLVYPPQSKEEYPFFKSYKGGTEQLLPENDSVPVTAPILADMNYSSGAIEVTTYPNPEQGGETSGDGWYLVGEEATVNATPNEHYAFNNWVLDGEIVSTDPEYTFEVQDE